ncbi:unnamed protein product [Urochloa humidicola]
MTHDMMGAPACYKVVLEPSRNARSTSSLSDSLTLGLTRTGDPRGKMNSAHEVFPATNAAEPIAPVSWLHYH